MFSQGEVWDDRSEIYTMAAILVRKDLREMRRKEKKCGVPAKRSAVDKKSMRSWQFEVGLGGKEVLGVQWPGSHT